MKTTITTIQREDNFFFDYLMGHKALFLKRNGEWRIILSDYGEIAKNETIAWAINDAVKHIHSIDLTIARQQTSVFFPARKMRHKEL